MFRMERTVCRGVVIFVLSGRIQIEHIAEMQRAFDSESQPIALDLKEVSLLDRDVVSALARWEAAGLTLENCQPYIREWISRGKVRS